MSDGSPLKIQKADSPIASKQGQKVHQDVADNNELHQIGNAEAGMVIGKPVHRGAEFSQNDPSNMVIIMLIIPALPGKVTYNL